MRRKFKRSELFLLILCFSFLLFCALTGVALEVLLAYKSSFLLGPQNETRRLLLRLGHAHGSLVSLFTLVWLSLARQINVKSTSKIGRLYLLSAVLMGSGFCLAGLTANERDPGVVIFLVPIGAALLLLSFLLSAQASYRAYREDRKEENEDI